MKNSNKIKLLNKNILMASLCIFPFVAGVAHAEDAVTKGENAWAADGATAEGDVAVAAGQGASAKNTALSQLVRMRQLMDNPQ